MIGLKEAIDRAKNFIVELNGEQEQFQVEEVTLSNDQKTWFVTLSYMQKIGNPNQLQSILGFEGRRTFKRVTIDNETQNVVGMSNWTFEKPKVAA